MHNVYERVKDNISLRSDGISPNQANPLPYECNFKIYRDYMRSEIQLNAGQPA